MTMSTIAMVFLAFFAVSASATVLRARSRNSTASYVTANPVKTTQENEHSMYDELGATAKGCPKDLHSFSRDPTQYTQEKWEHFLGLSLRPAVSALVARRRTENNSAPIKVFECGCGVGAVLLDITKLFPDQKFVLSGVDFSQAQVDVANRCLPAKSTVHQGNCSDLHGLVDTGSADLVISYCSGFRAVSSDADAREQLSELLRVANPQAVVVATHIVMPAGEAPSGPQCTDPTIHPGYQLSHKWWTERRGAMAPRRALHFIDDAEYRSNDVEKMKCRYAMWFDGEGTLEG